TVAATAVLEAPARSAVRDDVPVPAAPFFGDRVVESIDLDDIYPFVNKVALYRGQWQFRKGKLSDSEYAVLLEDQVEPIFKRLCEQARHEQSLQPRVVYGYYPCASSGDDLIIFDPQDPLREIERFTFPRQRAGKRLCISDFFRSVDAGQRDVIGMTCVTVGPEATRRAKALFEANDYKEYLYLHGFGVECAEALAE